MHEPYAGEDFKDITSEELSKFRTLTTCWRCLPESPCIEQPKSDSISVYKMLERLIVHTPADRGRLRKYLGDFTQTPEGLPFRNLYAQHLELLRWPTSHSCSTEPNDSLEKLAVVGKDGRQYHYLMPAFYRLLSWLLANGREFAVLIRTYGREGPHITEAVEAFLKEKHPTEKPPPSTNLPIDPIVWRLKRDEAEPNFSLYNDGTDSQDSAITEPRRIYQTWSSWNGLVTVVDDFVYWQSHQYSHSAAKPVWFDPDDRSAHHILFDDNIRFEDDGTNGIDLLHLNGSISQRITQREAINWEGIYFVQANLLKIIRDPEYFIKNVVLCEEHLHVIQEKE
ncbi:uncharacterized protein DEA37_0013938 [Paragonimus westermani]|uniref:Uncharacterized protein n=1 Tax=Paragonimus westermani TaxID=34504 RepID=A0A5J4N8F0_9TREM|nr:uncharacterized protein DEA37_0013938 [Paragonimus westermani]